MTADKKNEVIQNDYIPISSSVINGLELVKPNVTEPRDPSSTEFPLTPSPSDPSEPDSFSDKIVDEQCVNMFGYSGYNPTSFAPPSAHFPQSATPDSGCYYTGPPTPFLTPSPVNNPQTFLFDPAFIPQIYSYPQLPATSGQFKGHQGAFATHHTGNSSLSSDVSQPPSSKRVKTLKGSKKTSAKSKKSGATKTVIEMKNTLLDYHNAGSDEIWRAGGEPRKKSKRCQTTFRYPIQFSSLEDFAGMSVLLQIFGKTSTLDAGKSETGSGFLAVFCEPCVQTPTSVKVSLTIQPLVANCRSNNGSLEI